MDKPNTIESITPHSGQYSPKRDLRLNGWLAAATVAYMAQLLLLKRNPDWNATARVLVALTPLLPGLLYVRSWMRFIGGMDELQRRVQLEGFLFAALGTVLVGTMITTLDANGVSFAFFGHGLGIGGVFLAMFPLWLVGTAVANRRYR